MKYCLFGSALDTGNLGVSALGFSILSNLHDSDPEADITLFDHGRGDRKGSIVTDEKQIKFNQLGAVNSKRYYRPENLWMMWLAGRIGGLGNKGVHAIKTSDVVLDISGGDSFTDLYGQKRFNAVSLSKIIALQQKKPLILMPQTYGPFRTEQAREKASEIVKGATQAWARDLRSFTVLKDLLADSFDPDRHRCSVDVAFSLPVSKPENFPEVIARWLDSSATVVGLNISGLMYHDPNKAKDHYGFRADYNLAMKLLLERFLDQTDCKVVLVPHVITPHGHYESDLDACEHLSQSFGDKVKDRVAVSPDYESPCEIKYLISQFDWFCGMRMHSTIAGLSSGVPTSAVSYSPKTLGVFETCGLGDAVVDPCVTDTSAIVEQLWSIWVERDHFKNRLLTNLPEVRQMAVKPFDQIMQISSGI
ncbi:polysaccharide pyruvyl transferase family protein [Deltaproteobacteria bacterium IMCC39524]|nr:polysaccharide pyruvyl transferase family protein [Deltaproteobacteria bacterium IMCC39524]